MSDRTLQRSVLHTTQLQVREEDDTIERLGLDGHHLRLAPGASRGNDTDTPLQPAVRPAYGEAEAVFQPEEQSRLNQAEHRTRPKECGKSQKG